MNGGTTPDREQSTTHRHLPSPRRAAAVAVGGSVMGLVIGATQFQVDPEIAVVSMLPPQVLERSDLPSTTSLVNVLDHTLTPDDELAACQVTLRAVAQSLGMPSATDPSAPAAATADTRSVKERQQACSDLLADLQERVAASGELTAGR